MKVSWDDYSQYMANHVPNHQPVVDLPNCSYQKWWCSMVLLVYQRVVIVKTGNGKSTCSLQTSSRAVAIHRHGSYLKNVYKAVARFLYHALSIVSSGCIVLTLQLGHPPLWGHIGHKSLSPRDAQTQCLRSILAFWRWFTSLYINPSFDDFTVNLGQGPAAWSAQKLVWLQVNDALSRSEKDVRCNRQEENLRMKHPWLSNIYLGRIIFGDNKI